MGRAMERGGLRIYIGYAAGVGKTYAMLGEGRRRRDRGTDVVAGFVEAHGRSQTMKEIGDLEVVPPAISATPAGPVAELDVAAVIARHPDVALVDELAHTNVEGSRNEKRWQDVEELRGAGIDVITTLNIEHLESLNDLIERITGMKQVQTIPDEIVRSADQHELVDMTPYALRRRVAHGNVYPSERIDADLGTYFREETLGALRELSLLWMADRVDEALRDRMRAEGIEGPLETRERILVGVAGRPDDETLIRRAARMAARRGGELLAVYVRREDGSEEPSSLASSRALVADVGGRFEEVLGQRVPVALLQVARAEQVTQIVLGGGGTDRSRWAQLLRGSIANDVIRASGPIDVHVISQESATLHPPLRVTSTPGLPRRRQLLGLILAAVAIPVLTLVLTTVHERIGLGSIFLLYLSLVVGIATVGGLWPAIAAAITSSLLINWFFTPPLHTWTIAEPANVLGLIVFLFVATVVSVLVDRVARSRAEAERVRAEAEALAGLAARLAAEEDPLPDLVEQLRATFGLAGVAVFRERDGAWTSEASAGSEISGPDEPSTDAIDIGEGSVLVLQGTKLPAESRRVLAAFAAQLSVAVRGRVLAREASDASALAEIDRLRTAILAAVSHDLRTPLASIKASVSSLRDEDVAWSADEVREFQETIEAETDRLTTLVENLLDMSRLQTGTLTLVRGAVGLDEVVPRALASLSDGGHGVEVDVPEMLPRVDVDSVLLERAVANLIANARQWNPEGMAVRIQASTSAGRVELRVVDRGPGVKPQDRERMFRPFQRLGDRPTGNGVGLGLAVARGFVEAMGAELSVEDTPGGGLTMVIAMKAIP